MSEKSKRIKAALAVATALAIPAEGLRQYAYYDPPGILTVCYGSTTNVEKGKKYSLDECRARLDKDMLAAVETVERCAPNLPQKTLAALADATYNLGPKVVCDTQKSTLARYLKAQQIKAACEQLTRWDKAKIAGIMVSLPGLKTRRAAERALCLDGLES